MLIEPAAHDLHRRRFGRNLGVGLSLAAVVAIVFALTVVKVSNEDHGSNGTGAVQDQGAQMQEGAP